MKINGNITNLEQDLVIKGQVFEAIQNSAHLGTLIK
jgi:hypothetical protein